jgi:hypothetical protein
VRKGGIILAPYISKLEGTMRYLLLALLSLSAFAKAKFTYDYVKRGSLYRGKALAYFTCQRSKKDVRSKDFTVCGSVRNKEFRGVDLAGKELKGLLGNMSVYEGVSFEGADLNFALLSDSKIKETSFAAGHLAGAHLDNTVFEDVNFEEANLCGASLIDTDLTGAKNLEKANLQGAIVSKATKLPFPRWKAKKLGMIFVKDKKRGVRKFTFRHVEENCLDKLEKREVAALDQSEEGIEAAILE